MSEEQKRRLLRQAEQANKKAIDARENADHLASLRRAAIREAMDAGIPRQEIADAMGISRTSLYRIIAKD